jgi:hypothetical protein
VGLTAEDLGMVLPETVAGHQVWEVRARGICVCGHRVNAHRGAAGTCYGVPRGRRRNRAQTEVDCGCRSMVPVILVGDARPFRATWRSAMPAHPFTSALISLGIEKAEWLVPVPLACAACGRVGGVRAAYQPGSMRTVSAFACETCAPVENGL